MESSLKEIIQNLKSGEELVRKLTQLCLQMARAYFKKVLESLDKYLFEIKDGHLKSEGLCQKSIYFPLGSIRLRRRKYRDEAGGYRYLLDELLDLEGKSPLTPEIKETSLYLATLLPFSKAAQVMEKTQPDMVLSQATIHRLVKKITVPVLQDAELQRQRLFEKGEMPEGRDKVIRRLFLEGDGVNIALQRETARRAEIKVGIAYEGWESMGKGRYRLKGKTTYRSITSGSSFWEGFCLKLGTKYDLSLIQQVVVGGDGAGWVKGGVEWLGGSFQLDRFHLLRMLRQSLSLQTELIAGVYQACETGDLTVAVNLLKVAWLKTGGKNRENIDQVIRYLIENAQGLRDYRLDLGEEGKGLRRTGAIESNVDKLVANRMKKRGMSWRIAGARRMICLLELSDDGRLAQACRPNHIKKVVLPLKKTRRILVKHYKNLEEKWLQAGLPAILGPHADRPWVKYLKQLQEVSLNV